MHDEVVSELVASASWWCLGPRKSCWWPLSTRARAAALGSAARLNLPPVSSVRRSLLGPNCDWTEWPEAEPPESPRLSIDLARTYRASSPLDRATSMESPDPAEKEQ